jgi:tetratricopeptide (TPR) repeat protein
LAIRRELAKQNPEAFRSDVALTLTNMALLYSSTHRFREAEKAFDEATAIRRELAKHNPEVFRPDLAATLHDLAILYSQTQRRGEAERAFDEALSVGPKSS